MFTAYLHHIKALENLLCECFVVRKGDNVLLSCMKYFFRGWFTREVFPNEKELLGWIKWTATEVVPLFVEGVTVPRIE